MLSHRVASIESGRRSQSREVRRHDWKNNNIRFSGRTPFPFCACGERVIYRVRDVWKRCIGPAADCCFFSSPEGEIYRDALNSTRWMEIWKALSLPVLIFKGADLLRTTSRVRQKWKMPALNHGEPPTTLCMTPWNWFLHWRDREHRQGAFYWGFYIII